MRAAYHVPKKHVKNIANDIAPFDRVTPGMRDAVLSWLTWEHVLQAGVVLTVWVAVLAALAFLTGRWFFVERTPDEVHFATTGDGWRVSATRYRAVGGEARGLPIVLVHGLAMNRLSLDLTDETSLARHLAAAGHDTWVVEFRGRGLGSRPRLFSRYDYDWSFDEYVEQDLPAALAAVRRATGARELHLVGHSLGGMALYALLARPELAGPVRSVVTLGAPATFKFQKRYLAAWPIRNLRFLRLRFLMRLFAPLAGYWHPTGLGLMHLPENISGEVLRRFMVNASANLAREELLQLGDWIKHDAFRSIDHRRDYRAELEKVRAPVLLVAGNKDLLAPPNAVKHAHDALGSSEKKLVVASRGHGDEANYGHLDLVMGLSAAKDVFPLVEAWVAKWEASRDASS
jgi:pimeloyl-ACP methyl ester carboxylesterase